MKDKFYYKDGTTSEKLDSNKTLHRLDGPAVEYHDGSKEWWINGILHREDGPAEYSNGHKCWYINNKRHRTDGPAIELTGSKDYWYINNEAYSKDVYDKLMKEVHSMDKSLQLIDPRWWVRDIGKKR